ATPFPNPPPLAAPATTAANPATPTGAMPPADATQAPAATPPAPPANAAAPSGDAGPATAAAPGPKSPGAEAPPPMAPAAPGETSISTAELPQDLSPWGMFVHAVFIVKLVMIGLAVASLVTWTVWLAKWLELRSARAAVRRDLLTLENCPTLSQAHE